MAFPDLAGAFLTSAAGVFFLATASLPILAKPVGILLGEQWYQQYGYDGVEKHRCVRGVRGVGAGRSCGCLLLLALGGWRMRLMLVMAVHPANHPVGAPLQRVDHLADAKPVDGLHASPAGPCKPRDERRPPPRPRVLDPARFHEGGVPDSGAARSCSSSICACLET